MNMNNTIKRLLALASLAIAASMMLTGCADGPGNSSNNTSNGCTTDCTPIPVTCPDANQTFTAFNFNDATYSSVPSSGACVGCSIDDAVDVIDAVTDNYAIMSLPEAEGGSNSITVTDTQMSFPIGSTPGFIVSIPNATVANVALAQSIMVSTSSGGMATGDSSTTTNLPVVDVLGLLNSQTLTGGVTLKFVSVTATKSFNGVMVTFGGATNTLSSLRVYGAGICE
jgi:hypothetical protein